jgi:hypothetical protein
MKLRKYTQGIISSISWRGSERGQILYMAPVIILAIAAIIGVAIDASVIIMNNIMANNNAAIGCLEAADAHYRGESYQDAFAQAMENNNISLDAYSPVGGDGADLQRGIDFSGNSFWVVLTWTKPTSFLSIIGIDQMPVYGRARCKGPGVGMTPIAVKESAIYDQPLPEGVSYWEEYPILGNEQIAPPVDGVTEWQLADEQSGENFRGAILPHFRCLPGGGQPVNECPEMTTYEPAPLDPGESLQPYKELAEDCMRGVNCNIEYPDFDLDPVHIPIVDGTSNAQLCQSFQEVHNVGDLIVVVVFGSDEPDEIIGQVYSPPSGNRENVKLLYYAVYEVTRFEQNENNCNQVFAQLWGGHLSDQWGPYYSLDEIPLDFKPREISWNYSGALP